MLPHMLGAGYAQGTTSEENAEPREPVGEVLPQRLPNLVLLGHTVNF
jgi:hypothetical protein